MHSLTGKKTSIKSMGDKKTKTPEQNELIAKEHERSRWKLEVLFLTMFICNMLVFISFSLMAPIFPAKAEAKQVSYAIQGTIFGSCALTQIVCSPLIAKFMPYAGYKITFMTGIVFVSMWNIIFGFLPWLEDRTLFIISCFVCRIGLALGIVAVNNAIFVVVALTWPEDVAFRLGTIEASVGLGIMVGPGFTGLTQLVDYYFPFLVFGLLLICPAFIATILLPSGISDSEQSVSTLSLLKIPGVLVISIALLCFNSMPVMIEPILAPHLQPFGLSLSWLGFIFVIMPFTYAIFTLVVGKLVRYTKYKLPVMGLGASAMGIMFLFLGPVPLSGFKQYQQLWPTAVILGILGVCLATSVVPSYGTFITYAMHGREEMDREPLMAAVGSLFWMMMSSGEFIGPVIAGTIFEAYGFQWTMTAAGAMCLFTGTGLLVIFTLYGHDAITWNKCGGKNPSKPEEETALIQ